MGFFHFPNYQKCKYVTEYEPIDSHNLLLIQPKSAWPLTDIEVPEGWKTLDEMAHVIIQKCHDNL